jgi:hypothetical protein
MKKEEYIKYAKELSNRNPWVRDIDIKLEAKANELGVDLNALAVECREKAQKWYDEHPDWGNFQIPKEFRLPFLTVNQQLYLRANFGVINHLR